jgi:hypothetical protein
VDTQHARNSVGIHLSRLSLILERGWPIGKANEAMPAIVARKSTFPWLSPPLSFGPVTAREVLTAKDAGEHMALVQLWAKSVWDAWAQHHAVVRGWLGKLG